MMRDWIIGLAGSCALVANAGVLAAEAPNLFDKPVREQHLTLPPNPSDPNPKAHPKVSCWYYPGLMVKEVDLEWIKGAAQLSMVYIQKGKPQPACRRENVDGEYVIDSQDWSGYFRGERQGYLFFGSDDGNDGGDGFAVYDSNRRIFADVAETLTSIEPMSPSRDPDLRPWYYNPLVLSYDKVYIAPCSMRSDATHCWALIQRATGVPQVAAPDCDTAYEAEEKTTPPDQLDDMRKDATVIVYRVEAVIDGQGVARLTPKSPVVKCYPAR